jgi:hypothetical protein
MDAEGCNFMDKATVSAIMKVLLEGVLQTCHLRHFSDA